MHDRRRMKNIKKQKGRIVLFPKEKMQGKILHQSSIIQSVIQSQSASIHSQTQGKV